MAREVPLQATSTGKAFLARLPQDEAAGMLEQPLPGFTDTTVTDRELLLAELTKTRARGYAESAGEFEATLYGVSAPVLSATDARPLAVFSIWGPVSRLPVTRFAELGPIAVEAATKIGAVLSGLRGVRPTAGARHFLRTLRSGCRPADPA